MTQVPYPLKMKTMGKYSYFHKREEWKITDMLMNPMILMMVLPLLLITVLPKMMNDPETKKEMEQMQANMNMQNQASIFALNLAYQIFSSTRTIHYCIHSRCPR